MKSFGKQAFIVRRLFLLTIKKRQCFITAYKRCLTSEVLSARFLRLPQSVSVYPNVPSYDSTRMSDMMALITWHTWFPDSFSPFILSKCSDSLQSVCFYLSKRNQRHVSTWKKCYCKMSPAAHDMMNYNHMLISPTCSNVFTQHPITNHGGLTCS